MSGTPEQVGSRAMLAAGRRSAESVTRGEKGGDLWRPAETAAAVLGVAVPAWQRACHRSSSVFEICKKSGADDDQLTGQTERFKNRSESNRWTQITNSG
jgi:hypothetical protein